MGFSLEIAQNISQQIRGHGDSSSLPWQSERQAQITHCVQWITIQGIGVRIKANTIKNNASKLVLSARTSLAEDVVYL
jgi:hypothetical protein